MFKASFLYTHFCTEISLLLLGTSSQLEKDFLSIKSKVKKLEKL